MAIFRIDYILRNLEKSQIFYHSIVQAVSFSTHALPDTSHGASADTACADTASPGQNGESSLFRPEALQTPRPAWRLPC